ncbi:MAG TPA: DUF368 domain-containing protein [Candidatus Ventricola gallistercoris]|nr:DUF368 domain-containing protein [Candidatus Ventricola gallistercoris]
MEKSEKGGTGRVLLRVLQGALVGLGAVLPGISGGVLCVVFGVYQPVMEVLSDPVHALKKHIRLLLPLGVGLVIGFLGIARLLGFLLNRYPDPSVCLFVGLIAGMLPSLFREAGEQGRSRASFVAMGVAFAVILGLLLALKFISVQIVAGFGWYLFCGFCLALSVIVPGMSFSTLLMPLGLYTPFIDGIGRFDLGVLIPGGIGAVLTILLLARAVTHLMERHYSVLFHAIIGVVIAATVVIVPYGSFVSGGALVNGICLVAGAAAALLLDELGKRVR